MALRKAASVYRESMALVSASEGVYDSEDQKPDDKKGGGKTPSFERNPGMRQATLPLDSGDAVIQWPEQMTAENFKDLEDWLEIVMRKIKRSAETDGGSKPNPSRDGGND